MLDLTNTYEQLYEQCAETLGIAPVVIMRHGTGTFFVFISEFVGAPMYKGSSPDGFLQAFAQATEEVAQKHISEATRKSWEVEPFQAFGECHVDMTQIRAIERGDYDQERGDWRAILVLAGGDRISVSLFVQEALVALNKKGLA